MSLIDDLSTQFARLPGVGSRQARRFVYFLLSADDAFVARLIRLASELRRSVRQCRYCFRFYEASTSLEENCCITCSNPNAQTRQLLVVEKDLDIPPIEKSGIYQGRFFVLGGTVPIAEKHQNRVRVNEFVERVKTLAEKEGLEEIIFALSANPEGDNTFSVVTGSIRPLVEQFGLTISVLGRGLSTGTELEYVDDETLRSAFERRARK